MAGSLLLRGHYEGVGQRVALQVGQHVRQSGAALEPGQRLFARDEIHAADFGMGPQTPLHYRNVGFARVHGHEYADLRVAGKLVRKRLQIVDAEIKTDR